MTYSIIGSGNVGTALARQFARSGITVGIADTRGPDSIAPLAQELGDKVVPLTLFEAIEAEVVVLRRAVPRPSLPVASALSNWAGKVVVDAMNTYGVSPEELAGRASTDVVAAAFPGAKVVKTLNQLPAKLLAQDPLPTAGAASCSCRATTRERRPRWPSWWATWASPRSCSARSAKGNADWHGRPADSSEPHQARLDAQPVRQARL